MRKLTRRGAVWFVEAMFPGYFFAQFDYVTERRRVEHAPGVRGLLQFGDRLATIDSATIDALRQRMEAEELVTLDPEIKVGQEVQIAHGPLQGLEVLVTQLLPASERVRVLLEFLGRSLQMEVSEGNFNSTAGVGGFLVTIGNRRLPKEPWTSRFKPGSLAGLRQGTGHSVGRTLLCDSANHLQTRARFRKPLVL